MADGKRSANKEKWLKDLEEAGFSHRNGERIICYNCNLRPRSGGGLYNPARLHAELCQDCTYVKENDLVAKCLTEQQQGSDPIARNYAGADELAFLDTPGNIMQGLGQLPSPLLLDRDPNVRSERLKELQKKTTCMRCSDECPSIVFIPCRHVFCSDCARRQSRCMKCGSIIEEKDRFYWG